jgi:nucleotide-binding universal stress UspA family protein
LEGEVAAALEAQAARVEADLVVLSTHGRGAMGRFWLGSVADDLLRDLPRPVLLVRPHEGQPELKRVPDLKTILLPLDGSPLAEQILAPARELAKLFGSALYLVRIVRPVLRSSYLPEGGTIQGMAHSAVETIQIAQQRLEDEAQSYLDRIADSLLEQRVSVSTKVVINEEPAAGILAKAQLRQAGMIAMETRGRRGLSRMIVGSVADKIVHGTEVPVLLHRTRR